MSTCCSKHVEENIWRINNIKCIMLVFCMINSWCTVRETLSYLMEINVCAIKCLGCYRTVTLSLCATDSWGRGFSQGTCNPIFCKDKRLIFFLRLMNAYRGVKLQTDYMIYVSHLFVVVMDKIWIYLQWLMSSNCVCHHVVPQLSERKIWL